MIWRIAGRSWFVAILCLGTGFIMAPAMSQTPVAEAACVGLTLNKCRDLLDQNQVGGKDAGNVLRYVAQSHLDKKDPDEAILFLTVAHARDTDNALTYKLWGDAYVMRGEAASLHKGEATEYGIQKEYLQAAIKYYAGLTADPGSQANFSGVVFAVTRSGSCDVAEGVQREYKGRFEETGEQEKLASFIDDKC